MKSKLYTLLVSCFFYLGGQSQITTPVIKANFGVDADLRSNFFNNINQAGNDEWFSSTAANMGNGQFVIDTNGAASIVAAYNTRPASRRQPFSKLMRQDPYSVVNNRILLDAVFHRDFHGDDSTVFASGSNKNGMSPALWSCPVSQGVPDKNDILDAMIHVRRGGPNVTDSMWMFGGISIENTVGNRYFDFELYQTNLTYDRTNRTWQGFGPNAGHTSWQFDAAGNVVASGDIIFTFEYAGSGLSLVQARIWINRSTLSVSPRNFNFDNSFDGDGNGATYGYAGILPKSAGAFYTGLHNTIAQWAGPFQLVRQDNTLASNYANIQYMEFSVNLSKLGIDPASFSGNACGTPFRRVLIKTRASSSFTAELKDFIAPFAMFNYPIVDATTQFSYYCRTMPTVNVNVFAPMVNSIYTWTTTNGHIVGSNIGPVIQVDRPGTYYVHQQLHVQCPQYAQDSVVIYFDSSCSVLNSEFMKIAGSALNNRHYLNWQISNNQEAAAFDVEFSLDGRSFRKLAEEPAKTGDGAMMYYTDYPAGFLNAPVVYYRIKCVGSNGSVKYSQIISIRNEAKSELAKIYPNPTSGSIFMKIQSAKGQEASVLITDSYGRMVRRSKVWVAEGENAVELTSMANLPAAIYVVTIQTEQNKFIQRIQKK